MIMRIGALLVTFGIVALSATRMAAQTCSGAAAFSAGPVRLGAGLASSDGVKSYGVNMAVGAKAGPFVSGSLSRTEYSDIADNGTLVGLGAGYAFDLNRTKTVQFCPEVSFRHESGPEIEYLGSTISTSADAVGFGGVFGGVVPVTPTLDVVPFAGGAYVITQAWATLGRESESESLRYGEVDVGAGFVINKTLTLQPSVALPVGIEGAKSSFQLAFAFNFGSPKP